MKGKHELKMVSIRLVDDPPLLSSRQVESARAAVEVMAEKLSHYDRELFCILNLRTKGQVINANIVTMGTLNASLVCPREVFKSSILANAAQVLLIHNHPSGEYTPSTQDVNITKKLQICGDMIGIPVVDHIITDTRGQYFSFMENGLMAKVDQLWQEMGVAEDKIPYRISENPKR